MKSRRPRINLAVPWSKEGRDAFYKMAEELKAENSAELARLLLTEVMHCQFGLEKSKELGIIAVIAQTLPPPMYSEYACTKCSKKC